MNQEDQRLDHLLTYTTFHIGVYVSLVAGLISAGVFTQNDHWLLRFGVGCFLVAGLCGGVIGSSIPDFADFAAFSTAPIGFWGLKPWTYYWWAKLEHLAFWAGILPITLAFLCKGPALFKKAGGALPCLWA
jgi:hypothetical protein